MTDASRGYTVALIPARMGSSRFPGKPLASICGMPMIGHVYHRARMSARLDAAYVATCDEAIADYCRSIGAPVVMTSPAHERASDRCAEAMLTIEAARGRTVGLAVMIQGDEPMIRPAMIDAAVDGLVADPRASAVNLMGAIEGADELADPNEIKVVVDREGYALYFSRAPIPWSRDGGSWRSGNQICVIPFRREALLRFTNLPPTPLEMAESIDMLRFLEHGERVRMVPVEDADAMCSVDTPDDLAFVEGVMARDPLVRAYLP